MRAHQPLLLPLLSLVLVVGCGSSGRTTAGTPASAAAQLDFGVQMAKQGLWSEALFRFQQAERLEPASFRLYNNLAVAYEANGQFDRALEYYQKALQVSPNNRELRRNYSRFIEFYQSFRPREEPAGAGEATEPPAAPSEGSAGSAG